MRRFLWPAVAVGAVVLAVALWLFEPWRLWTSSTVDEAPPTASSSPSAPADETRQARDRELAKGRFVSAEHRTTGTARIVELADGRRFLRLEDLAGSDGPDLHVWITDRPSGGEWGSYDDGRYIRLGELKATHGNQNYAIPAKADLRGMKSVVIWCDRFNVAFGTARVSLT